jgi:hypothetical protein
MMKSIAILAVVGLSLIIPLAGACRAEDTSEKSATEIKSADEEITQEDLLEAQGSVHGKHGRRLFKTAYWAAGLAGDMKSTYDAYGYPSSRYREEKAGVVFEKWTYLEAGLQFTFRGDKLMATRRFNPGSALGIYLK